ncbi:YbfB/YjiJ family MFS transporter [Brevibacterium aurantiacum]|uniref:YbfB/YjiJ family MFS transporter n=1 Tax=Brevibacterium aurantiacum TaxID=273384 RepID=UPI00299F907E|nr:YbfB/YjiJ family MFS transporter [Brevibacterium aurantiacum]
MGFTADKTVNTTAVRGTLGLALAMGMGRFFYTPVLPLMVAALHWSSAPGAWIATLNYVGYFIGSLVIARGWVEATRRVYRVSLIVSTLCLAAIPLTSNLVWQGSVRTLAGIASGLIFVCITQRIPFVARRPVDSGLVYAGIGTGILVSGAIVLTAGSLVDWRGLWLICALLSAVFTAIAWTWPLPARGETTPATHPAEVAAPHDQPAASAPHVRRAMTVLTAGYFFQGFGYIIIGTYLVVLAKPVFGDTAAASTWVVAGIATAASPLIWSNVAARIGTRRGLVVCYSLQVGGAVLAVFGTNPVLLLISAALFGGTFVGAVMMTIGEGTQMGITAAAAKLTTWYSLGQIAGPALVALALSETIVGSFIAAAIALLLAMALTLYGSLTGNVER